MKSFSGSFYHQRMIATEDLRVIAGHQHIISSFAIVRANVSSTSLPSAMRYQTSVANSSRCSSSRKHHDALRGDGVNDTDASEVVMTVAPSFVSLEHVSKTKDRHC
jgi:hypothetical protein